MFNPHDSQSTVLSFQVVVSNTYRTLFIKPTEVLASSNGPLTRYLKLQVAHAPWMPRTFSPPPLVSDLGMHHDTCVTHVPWCMSGSLTRGWQGKRSRHSRRMRNPQFYVSGKRPVQSHLQAQAWFCWSFDSSNEHEHVFTGGIVWQEW